MSICDSGIGIKLFSQSITIQVPKDHPLLILANGLPWEAMFCLIEEDLRNSTMLKKLHYGRKLKGRIHLGAYLLQKMYDYKDRQTEQAIRDNAAYQVFCGYGIVDKWHCPDHTKIEKFRSRLSPETQQQLANILCKHAAALSAADPNNIDIDSTVQEANMTYPTDAKMLRKLGGLAFKVIDGLKQFASAAMKNKTADIVVDIKTIASKARNCFFLKKKSSNEEKSKVLSALLDAVSDPVVKVIYAIKDLSDKDKNQLPWTIRRSIEQLVMHGESYLLSVKNFITTGTAEVTKRLCFHLNEVACFNKKKEHEKYEFGRAFQLVRTGNFLFVAKSNSVRMDDKKSLLPIVDEYQDFFEIKNLNSVATDKGYYGANNVKGLIKRNVSKVGVQTPANVQNKQCTLSEEDASILSNRRAGIEPLIGHTKQGGQLGKSRMKNDKNIESSGYAAVLGFNLRQFSRALNCKEKIQSSHF